MVSVIDDDERRMDDACFRAGLTASERHVPILVIRLHSPDGIEGPPHLDAVERYLWREVGRGVQITEEECFCHGYFVPAVVATVDEADLEGAKRLVSLLERLCPALGSEVRLMGAVHIDEGALV